MLQRVELIWIIEAGQDLVAHGGGVQAGFVKVGTQVLDQHHEFIATPSGHDITGSQTAINASGDLEQGLGRVGSGVQRSGKPPLQCMRTGHVTGALPLQASYDAGIKNIQIVRATITSYCIQNTTPGTVTYHKGGPSGDIVSGVC